MYTKLYITGFEISLSTNYISHLDAGVKVAQERVKKKKEWVSCPQEHSLTVVGFRVGVQAHICKDELSVEG